MTARERSGETLGDRILKVNHAGGVVDRALKLEPVVANVRWALHRLGRDHVCALKRGDVEIPSDFGGVV
jgi:hypothetical protein